MIEQAIFISLWVFSINYTMQDGEIFGKLGNFLYNHLPKKIHDPVFECVVCMVPWHGSLLYWLFFGHAGSEYLKEWPLIVIGSMGINAILVKFFPHDDIKKI